MTIRNNRTEISLALGEAVLEHRAKGHEVIARKSRPGDENQSREERDDERLLTTGRRVICWFERSGVLAD